MDALLLAAQRELLSAAPATTGDHAPADGAADSGGHGEAHWASNNGPCFCTEWLVSHGSNLEHQIAIGCLWFTFAISILILAFYAYHAWRGSTGWEEVYVCCIEFVLVCIEIWHEFDSPATLYLSTGNQVLWCRYAEWLLSCPVILIHVSNLTGLKNDYTKRTMAMLVSDLGTIVWGITAAMAKAAYLKIIFFLLGLSYGAFQFFNTSKVYIEAYHQVPKGTCRMLVRVMAWCFFCSWAMFPILFLLGPEGFNHISFYGSTIGHTVADIFSKNLWGFLAHILRNKIHEYIIIHGDIRVTKKIKVAGEETEVEEYVDDAEDEDAVRHSTKKLANRESFLVIRDKLKARGVEVRASLDGSTDGTELGNKLGTKGMDNAPMVDPGRVILVVPDVSMVDFFREQFNALPIPYEMIPALGVDNALQLVQQAMQLGGCDFVLLHPEFLRDRSPNGVVGRLRVMGQRVCAFGWAPAGPMRELIEGSGLDGWLEGPSFGTGINREQLLQLVARMQTIKKTAMMNMMMGGGMSMMGGAPSAMGGMGSGMGMQHQASLRGAAGLQAPSMMSNPSMAMNNGMYGGNSMMMGQNGMSGMSMMSQGAGRVGTNPLFGSPPSPLGSQLGSQPGAQAAMNSSLYGSTGAAVAPAAPTPAAPAAAAGGQSEAEMLQQLMAEIGRLKSELGEH